MLVGLNNKFYRDPQLSISLGAATRRAGLTLEKVISLADNAMYRSKSRHYHAAGMISPLRLVSRLVKN